MLEPAVCSPIATGTILAPTAAPEPLLVPPAVCSRFHGFRVGGILPCTGM